MLSPAAPQTLTIRGSCPGGRRCVLDGQGVLSAFYVSIAARLTLENLEVVNCACRAGVCLTSAEGSGGALWAGGESVVQLNSCRFANNSAQARFIALQCLRKRHPEHPPAHPMQFCRRPSR